MIRLMIVDDEPFAREFLAEKIPELCSDFLVTSACADGREALDILLSEDARIDMVIADIKMPEMDGLELASEIRARWPGMPVVILSGFGEFEFAQRAIAHGVSEYLLKPIVNDELQAMLHKMRDKIKREPRGEEEFCESPSIVQAAKEYIEKNYQRPISLSMIADEIGVNASYLSGVFHREMQQPYIKYLTQVRMQAAKNLINKHPAMLITDVAERTGYISVKHFLHVFKKHFGYTPSELRQRNSI